MGKTGKNSKSKYYLDLQNKVYPKGFFPPGLNFLAPVFWTFLTRFSDPPGQAFVVASLHTGKCQMLDKIIATFWQ